MPTSHKLIKGIVNQRPQYGVLGIDRSGHAVPGIPRIDAEPTIYVQIEKGSPDSVLRKDPHIDADSVSSLELVTRAVVNRCTTKLNACQRQSIWCS